VRGRIGKRSESGEKYRRKGERGPEGPPSTMVTGTLLGEGDGEDIYTFDSAKEACFESAGKIKRKVYFHG